MKNDCSILISCSAGTQSLFKSALAPRRLALSNGCSLQWCASIYSATARLAALTRRGSEAILTVELDFLSPSEMRAFHTLRSLPNVVTVGVLVYNQSQSKKNQAIEAGCRYTVALDDLSGLLAQLCPPEPPDAVTDNECNPEIDKAVTPETSGVDEKNTDPRCDADSDASKEDWKENGTARLGAPVTLTQEELNVLLGD